MISTDASDVPQELTLAGNRITVLPAAISKLTNLQKLQVSGNLLARLPDEIGYLASLEVRKFHRCQNKLKARSAAHPYVGHMMVVQGLWLHGNLLEEIPSSIGSLQSLNVLSLAGNCLKQLPAHVGELGVRHSLWSLQTADQLPLYWY